MLFSYRSSQRVERLRSKVNVILFAIKKPTVRKRELFIGIQEKAKGCRIGRTRECTFQCSVDRKARDCLKAECVLRDLVRSRNVPGQFNLTGCRKKTE